MARKSMMGGLFDTPKDPKLAAQISIRTPGEFRKSIQTLKKSGGKLTQTERNGLILGQNRSKVQLKRKDLGKRERKQFTKISKMRIPPIG